MDALTLSKKILTPEFDYGILLNLLKKYKNPRSKISSLLRAGLIVRVKKGLYVLGPDFERPYSKYILANLIYGPSYLSGLSALSFYGLIPERVEIVFSTTCSRKKLFNTTVGIFQYNFLKQNLYKISTTLQAIDSKRSFMIATPEKAVVELLVKQKHIKTTSDIADYFESMRIEETALKKFRMSEIKMLNQTFGLKSTIALASYLKELKGE